ncbi:MAG: response regulator transcription factor [Congregibacter sp.]
MPEVDVSIAIVEDLGEIRSGLQALINGFDGYRCELVFANAEDAMVGLAEAAPDAILMDIGLPGMSGIEATRLLTQAREDLQIIMLTVYEANEQIFESLAAGASGYVLKNARPEELIAAVDEVIRGGSPMSGAIARRVVEHFRKPLVAPIETNPAMASLSPREAEILALVVQGIRLREIAERLHISRETVRTHTRHIYRKLQVTSRAEAAAVVTGHSPK